MVGRSPKGPGYIYIFVNDTNPNEVKIGLSINPVARQKQLHSTGTARSMNLHTIWEVPNMKEAELIAHEVMKGHRVNPRREFFHLVPEEASLELETPHQHFGGHDLADEYLCTLSRLIEDAWDYCDIDYTQVKGNTYF
ncbi:GIY-YIG nuclease family protein [Vibrio splendidus]|uniref:GIY-YIG nuclease family protein n=1 Tax=Vibrio splendidus TaxID=29497 RepID=UPI00148BC7D1|nr:GIY-YIG nuclease family protein [Vibrio splendidus]NOJ09386.1 GIY-YIG nuclease family protein [Vibrio splendidus]